MQYDWSNIWFEKLTGESYLQIMPNAEHSSITGIPELIETASVFSKSI